jgi:hypothetical protein
VGVLTYAGLNLLPNLPSCLQGKDKKTVLKNTLRLAQPSLRCSACQSSTWPSLPWDSLHANAAWPGPPCNGSGLALLGWPCHGPSQPCPVWCQLEQCQYYLLIYRCSLFSLPPPVILWLVLLEGTGLCCPSSLVLSK